MQTNYSVAFDFLKIISARVAGSSTSFQPKSRLVSFL